MTPTPSAVRKLPLLACFGIVLAITTGYQWFYCNASSRGELSGLFFSGTRIPEPPELERYGFHYRDSIGYDGQMYRMIAHDPFRRKGFWDYLDDPRLRGQRILIPFAAGLLGGGSMGAVDFWYVAIVDILLALGGLCFVLLADAFCARLRAIALYLAIPAVIASTDRMVLDGPSVAGLLAVFVFFRAGKQWPLFGLLALLPFLRETNLAVSAGVVLAYVARGNVRYGVGAAATAAPGLAWLAWIASWTPPSGGTVHLSAPLLPHVLRLFTLVQRPLPPWQNTTMQVVDFVGVVALLFTFVVFAVGFFRAWRLRSEGGGTALDDVLIILPTALTLAFVGGPDVLRDAYGFMRIDSLLVAWAALHLLRSSHRAERLSPPPPGLRSFQNAWWITAGYLAACSIGILIFRVRPVFDLLER